MSCILQIIGGTAATILQIWLLPFRSQSESSWRVVVATTDAAAAVVIYVKVDRGGKEGTYLSPN